MPCTPVGPTSRPGLIKVSYSSTVSQVAGSRVMAAISTTLSLGPNPVVSTSTTTGFGILKLMDESTRLNSEGIKLG